MRNPLIQSAVAVTGLWWTVATVHAIDFTEQRHLYNPLDIARHVAGSVGADAVAAAAAASTVLLAIIAMRKSAKRAVRHRSHRGFTTSLGIIPPGLGEPLRMRRAEPEFAPDDPLARWFTDYQGHASHAAVMRAAIEVMAAHDTPAAPVAGWHADLSLFEHSCNVCRYMVTHAADYTYEPHVNKQGEIIHQLHDPMYRFDPEDPLVGLVGMTHDIGKVETYVRDKEGRISEKRTDHDRIGSFMLARLAEAWDLPAEDRRDLIASIAHYHHPNNMPNSVSDRARALMEFLREADSHASREEGREWLSTRDTDGADAIDPLFEAFSDLIVMPGRLNGKNPSLRIGYKHNDKVYLAEEPLRNALADRLGMNRAQRTKQLADRRYVLTVNLMDNLDNRDLLFKNHNGQTFSKERAYWNVTIKLVNQKDDAKSKYIQQRHVIILKLQGELKYLCNAIPNSLGVPESIEPYWGVRAAVRKDLATQSTTPVDAEDPADPAVEIPTFENANSNQAWLQHIGQQPLKAETIALDEAPGDANGNSDRVLENNKKFTELDNNTKSHHDSKNINNSIIKVPDTGIRKRLLGPEIRARLEMKLARAVDQNKVRNQQVGCEQPGYVRFGIYLDEQARKAIGEKDYQALLASAMANMPLGPMMEARESKQEHGLFVVILQKKEKPEGDEAEIKQ